MAAEEVSLVIPRALAHAEEVSPRRRRPILRRVLNSLWQRLRAGNQRERQRKDEAAKEQFLLEQVAVERERKRPPGMESISNNTDWTYIPPP